MNKPVTLVLHSNQAHAHSNNLIHLQPRSFKHCHSKSFTIPSKPSPGSFMKKPKQIILSPSVKETTSTILSKEPKIAASVKSSSSVPMIDPLKSSSDDHLDPMLEMKIAPNKKINKRRKRNSCLTEASWWACSQTKDDEIRNKKTQYYSEDNEKNYCNEFNYYSNNCVASDDVSILCSYE